MQIDLNLKSTYINKFIEDNKDSIETFSKFKNDINAIKRTI